MPERDPDRAVRLEDHEFQFRYRSDDDFAFMNQGTCETITLSAAVPGDNAKHLQEKMVIDTRDDRFVERVTE